MTFIDTDTGADMAKKHKSSGGGGKRPTRLPFHAGTPLGFHPGAPAEAIKAEFGRNLQKRMVEKNWNQSDLAREAAKFMPDKTMSRDNVSNWVRGMSLPGTVRLNAISMALGCKSSDLLPVRSTETIDSKAPPLDARWLGDGTVWLRVNQAVPQAAALQILALLGQNADPDRR